MRGFKYHNPNHGKISSGVNHVTGLTVGIVYCVKRQREMNTSTNCCIPNASRSCCLSVLLRINVKNKLKIVSLQIYNRNLAGWKKSICHWRFLLNQLWWEEEDFCLFRSAKGINYCNSWSLECLALVMFFIGTIICSHQLTWKYLFTKKPQKQLKLILAIRI